MKQATALKLLVILLLSSSTLLLVPSSINLPVARAAAPARLEVWSPDVHSSNITSLSLFPVGSQFTVHINITGSGRLLGFDVTVTYNMTAGIPNVIQAVPGQNPLTGGMLDPAGNPSGCGVYVAKSELDQPPGRIRMAAAALGGCTIPSTGILFSITFQVTGIGDTSIDVKQYSGGKLFSSIIGGVGNPPSTINVDYTPVNAYFRNQAGIPPTPSFTWPATVYQNGASVTFNATQSKDSDDPTAANGGAQIEPIVYDAKNDKTYENGDPVIIGPTPALGTPLGAPPPNSQCRIQCNFQNPDPHIVFNDTKGTGHWAPGDTVVYDALGNLDSQGHPHYAPGDWIITGQPLATGTTLTFDPQLTYVDNHANNFWDNGYIWDWGDGSGLHSTGNVTSHVFQIASSISGVGQFEVKLVVVDSDNGLTNSQVQVVRIGIVPTFDVAVSIDLSRQTYTVGDKVGISITVSNRGNQVISKAKMNVTYDLNTETTIGLENITKINSPGSNANYTYTIDTSSLSPRTYTVTVEAAIINATSNKEITNASPDFSATRNFVLQPPTAAFGAWPLIIGGTAAGVAVVSAVAYLIRRRRPVEE